MVMPMILSRPRRPPKAEIDFSLPYRGYFTPLHGAGAMYRLLAAHCEFPGHAIAAYFAERLPAQDRSVGFRPLRSPPLEGRAHFTADFLKMVPR